MLRRSIALVLLSGLLSSAAQAGQEKPPILFDVLASSQQFDGAHNLTAKRWAPLIDVQFAMPYAVQLDGEVPLQVQEQVGGGSNSPIGARSILFSSELNRNIFCSTASSRMLGKAGPCLVDMDGDGRFDTATKAGAMAKRPQGMGLSNNSLLGVDFGPRMSLPSPVAYHRVDYSAAPTAKGHLLWASDFNPKKPGPVKVEFAFEGNNDWAGTGVLSDPIDVTFTGSPVTVDLQGLRITVIGFGPKRELNYTMSGALTAAPLKLKFLDRVIIIR